MNNGPTIPPSTSPAQQWLGPTTTSQDAIHLIAGGVAQLQAAMLKQMSTDKTGERTPETVKPGTTVLPTLPPVRSESSSVDLLDWMELIEAPMCDLSDGSATWWKQVRSKAAFAYDKWVVSGPMERLSITPEGTNDLEEGRWSRVNSRAASMVLTALDESIRSELVSRRMTGSVTAIVFRLLTLYQPGGEEEKYRTLQQLQSPPKETDPAKAVESLRAWNRWLRRCQELNIQAPDPSLQVRALNSVVKGVLEKNSEACFRTNLVRSNLKIDSNPTKESVEKLYKHLMGECESLATATSTVAAANPSPTTRPEPKLKPVRTDTSTTTSTPQPPTPRSPSQHTSASGDEDKDKRSAMPCKFFGKTYKRCARLQKCPFLHTWEGLEREKPTRCLACGGKHMVKDCPHKKPHGTSSTTTGAQGTSTTPSPTAKAPPTTPRNTSSTSSTATAASKTVRIDDNPEVEHVPARGVGAVASDALDLKEVLADVGKVLKAMSTTTLKKFTVEEAEAEGQQRGLMETEEEIPHKVTKSAVMEQGENEEGTGLLDSGASHSMRPATWSEYQKGQPVKVTLAGEDVKLLMQNDYGTILVQEEQTAVQPIVPLGAVIQELGYTLNWSPKALKLTHPSKKSIKVKIRNHCPEVAACDALGLIRDLECAQVNALNERVASLKARLEVIKKEEKRDWLELLQEFSTTGTKTLLLKAVLTSPITKDLPAEVQTKLVQDFDLDGGESYLKALPLSRRKRRALAASRSWVVHLCSGGGRYKNDPFEAIPTAGKVVLEIDKDASRLWDLNRRDGVYQLLLWAACTGRIADIISSPLHGSWPTSQTPKHGPEAYAMRTLDEPYGIKDLAVFQRQRVDEETAYVAKQLMVWMLAQMCGKRNVGFLLETPATQHRLSERRDEGVSVWSTEMWKNFGSISGIKEFSFYMGAFGHRARCPTTIATTYPSVNQIDYHQGVPDDCVPATLLSDKELRRWPRSFKEFVAEAIKDYHMGSWKEEEEEMIRAGVRMNKLTKEQREAWHRHLFNDHQPYRADCAVCINAQATGYQHRRRRHPSMYSMALDLAGPFKVKGRDMDHDDYKYIMVAAYRCPREYMSEKAAAELDKDLYVPDEASEHEGEDFLEVMGGGGEACDVEGSGLSEEEKEELPLGPETMDDAVEGLAQPEEWATVYVTRPLRGRTNHYVVQAAKEILLQLRQSGLYVGVVHTDRAREFKAKAFKDWTVDSQLRHTKTAGADPAGNSSAELGIKWAKARVRTLLTASGAPQRDWPMAIQHAASDLWARTFPDSPWTSPPATAFGNEVWFRSKAYQGKREKKHEAAGLRWKKGWYRGPAVDVKRGHLIVREDGGLTVAKSVKFGVFEPNKELKGILSPAVAEGLPEEEESEEGPPTRVELKEEIEFRARKLLEEENFSLEEVVNLYKLLELRGDSDTRLGRKTKITSWYTGAFVHGGVAGVRANLKEFPHTTMYLVKVAKHYCGEVNFSALGIAKNAQLGLHRDSHNYGLSKNYVIPLADVEGGSLWVQDDEIEGDSVVHKALANGKVIRGKCLEYKKGSPMEFFPRRWHEVQPWVGERLVMLMYTPRATKLSTESVEALQEVGFGIDPLSLVHAEEDLQEEDELREPLQDSPAAAVKMLHVSPEPEEEDRAFVEIEENEVFQGKGINNPAHHLQPASKQGPWEATARKVIKKAEVQYTAGIEDLLNNLKKDGKPLEVTHNVSLQDVRKNIDAWKESALKEFTNLTKVKQAFRVVKRSELPSNCRIVPCKGVYTVKPDKSELGYRRKTRFVACGNHVPEGEGDFDLFATGVDATSLRTMLAVNAKKPWKTGTTDVRQAFVLAKWRGEPVAMEPPGIALELGLAAPGDMWYVEQAIYGLRESPALWSQFRDEQMKMARWTMEVEGENVTMMIEQMITDNQIWKVVREDQPQGEVYGYIMVYIDDLLIHAQEQAMYGFFQWVSTKWEVDALDILDYDHPIRFLGMELHRVKNGIELSQEGFIGEILRAHHHKGGRSCSQGPKETLLLSDEEEQALIQAEPTQRDPKDPAVKEAQRRVGELLWLMGRTRPDIQHTVSIMAARLLRCPEMVNRIGERLLDYLNETKHYRLAFTQNEEDIVDGLDVFTDSSFAPSGGRSQGAAAVFYGNNPLVWRSGRQQLTTLSTAESELVESVEGTLLGLSTRGLLTELLGEELHMTLWVDNSAAVSLLTTSSGSWRTRHLRLRSNWVREMATRKEISIKYIPGERQKADLGTKPFTRDRLRQLVEMWNIQDRPVSVKSLRPQEEKSWLWKLVLLCQVCGAKAREHELQAEVPWDLLLAVIVLGVAVIGLWEGAKGCLRARHGTVKALRAAANQSQGKITRNELKELQCLLQLDPERLSVHEKERLLDLREKFNETMPKECSPLPRYPLDDSRRQTYEDVPISFRDEPTTTSSSSSGRNKQPRQKVMRDQETQTDREPVFTRVQPQAPPTREVIAGPFYQVPGREHVHVFRECWGLRHAGRVQQLTLCRCCAENGGNRMY